MIDIWGTDRQKCERDELCSSYTKFTRRELTLLVFILVVIDPVFSDCYTNILYSLRVVMQSWIFWADLPKQLYTSDSYTHVTFTPKLFFTFTMQLLFDKWACYGTVKVIDFFAGIIGYSFHSNSVTIFRD